MRSDNGLSQTPPPEVGKPKGGLRAWPAVLALLLCFAGQRAMARGHQEPADTLGTPSAATPRPWVGGRERFTLIGIGRTDILDTYLSQEKATGAELRYVYGSMTRKGGSPIGRTLQHQAFVTSAGTRGNGHSVLSAMYNLKFGWHYYWDFPARRLGVRLGGLVDGTLGGAYNTRNSNNPAQARAALSIDPSAAVAWRFAVRGKPFALRYEVSSPLVGAAFSPNYGQSYYEIFTRGNYDHNVVCTHPGNALQLHQLLTLDFRLWRTTFTVGYLGDVRQMRANSLKYHQYSHNFVIGWRY